MPLVTDGIIDDEIPFSRLPIIFWHNVVSVNNVTTDSEDPDFPVTNVANSSLGLKWKQDFTGSPIAMPDVIAVDVTGQGPINYVGIAGHNLGTAGATVAVEGSSYPGGESPMSGTASPANHEYVTGFQPGDDSPLVIMFDEVESQEGDFGVVRIRLQSPGTVAMEVGVLYVGYATFLDDGIQADHTPLPLATVHDFVAGQSENGGFLGRIVLGQWQESTATIANMETDWARDNMLPFLEHAAEEPFFWAWNPLDYPEEVSFAWLSNDPQLVFDIDGYVAIDLGMKGIAE
jgi:hypothetical protein